MQPKWRKLVKTEKLWALEAAMDGLHFTQDGEDHWVLPFDYIVDMLGERVIYRARDFQEMIEREKWMAHSVAAERGGAMVYLQKTVVEVANHVADGKEHADLWVVKTEISSAELSDGQVASDTQQSLTVHRQDWIDKLLADGYVWEEATP